MSTKHRDEYADDLHAELGYRQTSQREVRQREWFSLRGDPGEVAPTPKAFQAIAKRLMKLRARHKKPHVYRAANAAYYAKHKEHLEDARAKWRRSAAGKASAKAASSRWYLANQGLAKARQKKRYAAKAAGVAA